MRNRIVHGYSGVDMSIVWDTIHEDFPFLKVEMEKCNVNLIFLINKKIVDLVILT